MNYDVSKLKELYAIENYDTARAEGHEHGRNTIYICSGAEGNKYVLRVSDMPDRTYEEYLAETEFVHFLAENGAPVADVIPSVNGRLAERAEQDGKTVVVSLFEYAKGMLISDNGYRYRAGAPLDEYFYNTGKALGCIHRLSKTFSPASDKKDAFCRKDYFDKYNMEYIGGLIPGEYAELKGAVADRLEKFRRLPRGAEDYGLVHFDFSDGNYHIDMDTGRITVFDFDNCMYCWYMFDLANLWVHGEGWCRAERDPEKRMKFMNHYFGTVFEGYRSETAVSGELLEQLPLFIDMVLVENIVDELECCASEGEEPDYDDIEDAAECLINGIPYAGIGKE